MKTKRDALWWKAFWYIFGGNMMFYDFLVIPGIAIGPMLILHADFFSKETFLMASGAVLLSTLPSAAATLWILDDEVGDTDDESRRKRRLESVAVVGRQLMLMNLVGWIALIVMFLYRKVLEPVWGCIWFAVHNTRTVDDEPHRELLSESEKQIYAIGAVAVLFAVVAVLKFRYFGH